MWRGNPPLFPHHELEAMRDMPSLDSSLPVSWDWRNQSVVTPVKNQVHTIGVVRSLTPLLRDLRAHAGRSRLPATLRA